MLTDTEADSLAETDWLLLTDAEADSLAETDYLELTDAEHFHDETD